MRHRILLVFLVCSAAIFGQSPYVLPGTITDEIADRWEILYEFDHLVFASQRNTSRKEITDRALFLFSRANLTKKDQWDVNYILKDNNDFALDGFDESHAKRIKVYEEDGVFYHLEGGSLDNTKIPGERDRSFLKYFYKSEANFFEINSENFTLRANPILNLKYGNGVDDSNILFQNTRGVEVRGTIDKNVYFYTSILENQARFNNYLEDRIARFRTIQGQGFYKDYKSGVIENLQGYDYLNAQAYVGVNVTKSVAVEFGHGKHFIGNGIRSLLLSDYSTNYFYLKFNTRVWKFHYQNIFAELAPVSSKLNGGNSLLPKKYMANHYLAFKPNKNFEIGIYETVVFSREDRFEFQYLNPIILYRTVEQFLDSPDNVLIGLNAKWNIKNRIQLYGQVMLDEFKLGEITSGDGWWANKYGIQAGMKYINAGGIDHLDLQIEYNRVRPYTYAHRDSLTDFPQFSTASYSHHSQPLAHPQGSNFSELVMNVRYRFGNKTFVNARFITGRYGQNPQGQNLGSNILLHTESRENDYGNVTGQGIATDLFSIGVDVSYQFYHNYFFDLNLLYRKANAEIDDFDIDTKYIGGGLRVNLGNIIYDY